MRQQPEHEPAISGYPAAFAAPLSVMVLGSGGPAAAGRASSGYLVLVNGAARLLVDLAQRPSSFRPAGVVRKNAADGGLYVE